MGIHAESRGKKKASKEKKYLQRRSEPGNRVSRMTSDACCKCGGQKERVTRSRNCGLPEGRAQVAKPGLFCM